MTEDTYTDEELLEAVRKAAKFAGEPDGPITTARYQEIAKIYGLPAHMTLIKRLLTTEAQKKQPWVSVCKLAGIQANTSRQRAIDITRADCIAAVAAFLLTPAPHTYAQYERWAKDSDQPSGSSVRAIVGKWSTAVKEAK